MGSYRENTLLHTSSDEDMGAIDASILSETSSSSDDEPIEKSTTTSSVKKTVNRDKATLIEKRLNNIKEILARVNIPDIIDYDDISTETYLVNKQSRIRNPSDVRQNVRKDTTNFAEVMNNAGIRFKYIKSGSSGHTFKAYDATGDIKFAVKVVAYQRGVSKYGIHDKRRPENAEIVMLKALAYFVSAQKTPHITLPISCFNTSITHFVNLEEISKSQNKDRYKRYNQFIEKYHKGQFEDLVSVLISEWADMGDLLDYIRTNYQTMTGTIWRVLLFQIISAMAMIHLKYPTFRHNDLKANNILLMSASKPTESTTYRYTVDYIVYEVPYIGMQAKLWDFDFACIPKVVDNTKVYHSWTDKINIKPIKNQYYDIHFFFNTLMNPAFFPNFNKNGAVPQEVKRFIYRVVPPDYRFGSTSGNVDTEGKGRLLVNKELTTPLKLLAEDEFFRPFRLGLKTKS
jgi:hypothetical protein